MSKKDIIAFSVVAVFAALIWGPILYSAHKPPALLEVGQCVEYETISGRRYKLKIVKVGKYSYQAMDEDGALKQIKHRRLSASDLIDCSFKE